MNRQFSMNLAIAILSGLTIWLSGCGGTSLDETAERVTANLPNYLDAADGINDEADYDCLIVLRSIARIPNGPGYVSTCDLDPFEDSCRYVWQGQLDLDASRAEEQLGWRAEVSFGEGVAEAVEFYRDHLDW